MTAQELINLLKLYPPNTPILVSGYEGGYADASDLDFVSIVRDVNGEWYYGPHELASCVAECTDENVAGVPALILY